MLGASVRKRLVWWVFIRGGQWAGGLAPVTFPLTLSLDVVGAISNRHLAACLIVLICSQVPGTNCA